MPAHKDYCRVCGSDVVLPVEGGPPATGSVCAGCKKALCEKHALVACDGGAGHPDLPPNPPSGDARQILVGMGREEALRFVERLFAKGAS